MLLSLSVVAFLLIYSRYSSPIGVGHGPGMGGGVATTQTSKAVETRAGEGAIHGAGASTSPASGSSTATTSKESCRDMVRSLRVAVYSGPGVWRSGLEALHLYLESRGIEYADINATDIEEGVLDKYDVLVMPGGWAYDYFRALGYRGSDRVKSFVENGGGYLGICAGAFYASRAITWETRSYYYSLGLVDVDAVGPKEEYPWPRKGYIQLVVTEAGRRLGLNETYTALYYGGPEFENPGKGVVVVALYSDDKEPAIVLARYGRGRVVLTGVHLEVSEDTWPVLDALLAYLAGCRQPLSP